MGAAEAARETKRLQGIRWAGPSMCNGARTSLCTDTFAVQQSMSMRGAQTGLPAEEGQLRATT